MIPTLATGRPTAPPGKSRNPATSRPKAAGRRRPVVEPLYRRGTLGLEQSRSAKWSGARLARIGTLVLVQPDLEEALRRDSDQGIGTLVQGELIVPVSKGGATGSSSL